MTRRFQIAEDHPDATAIRMAGAVLKRGGVIIHATETVYGLAARWDDALALARVDVIKQRLPAQPYSLLVSNIEQIIALIGWDSPRLQRLLTQLYPAPVTVLLPRKMPLETKFWNDFPLLGFRMPAHHICRELLSAAGLPLITTSANRSGEAPPVSADVISGEVSKLADVFLDSGTCRLQTPSTIVQLDEQLDDYRIIRRGALPEATLSDLWRKLV